MTSKVTHSLRPSGQVRTTDGLASVRHACQERGATDGCRLKSRSVGGSFASTEGHSWRYMPAAPLVSCHHQSAEAERFCLEERNVVEKASPESSSDVVRSSERSVLPEVHDVAAQCSRPPTTLLSGRAEPNIPNSVAIRSRA
jgi:hypothetical protein